MSGPIHDPMREFLAREATRSLKIILEKIEKDRIDDNETIRARKIFEDCGVRPEEITLEDTISILMKE